MDRNPRSKRHPTALPLLHDPIFDRHLPIPSLSSLELVHINFRELIRLPPNLALRELKLNACNATHGILSYILTEYRVLATLEFEHCSNFGFMQISSPYLKKLTLGNFIFAEYIIVEDVPNLEILALDKCFSTRHAPFTLVNAPKLRFLGFVNADITRLQFGETCFQSVDQEDSSDLVDIKYWEREGSFDCLDRHLKYLKIEGFLGEHYDLGFTKFFIQNAQVLKVISVIYSYLGRKWKKPELCELILKNKASLDAELILY